MAVYKFRITFEDFEDICRDIEIRPSQTFFDFHRAILGSIGFDEKHAGSFFVSDDSWRKGQEITLLEKDLEPGVKLMKNVKISSFIEQPNQKFIYLYDIQVLWTFQIQLIKIAKEDETSGYPRVTRTVGQPPKQYKQKLLEKLKEEVNNSEHVEFAEKEEPLKENVFTDDKMAYIEGNEKHEWPDDASEISEGAHLEEDENQEDAPGDGEEQQELN